VSLTSRTMKLEPRVEPAQRRPKPRFSPIQPLRGRSEPQLNLLQLCFSAPCTFARVIKQTLACEVFPRECTAGLLAPHLVAVWAGQKQMLHRDQQLQNNLCSEEVMPCMTLFKYTEHLLVLGSD
jgi:hypothetical protein